MEKPYHYVRYRWRKFTNLKKVSEDFRKSFDVHMKLLPDDDVSVSFRRDERKKLKVMTDTLATICCSRQTILY